MVVVACTVCGAEKELWPSQAKRSKRWFCSPEHHHAWQVENLCGEANPNYGKHWGADKRKRQSELVTKRMDSAEIRRKVGAANRGKKFSPERVQQMHGHRSKESYSHPNPSGETRRKIGLASQSRLADETYRERLRQTMEARGHWIPLENKLDYDVYFAAASWPRRMWDLVQDASQLVLLEQHGVFAPHKNPRGVVRDHMFSRRSGFERGVFPEILRHPCNLQVLLHADNVAKKHSRYIDADAVSLETLTEQIMNYDKPWFEQEVVRRRIEEYRKGKRWKNEHKEGGV